MPCGEKAAALPGGLARFARSTLGGGWADATNLAPRTSFARGSCDRLARGAGREARGVFDGTRGTGALRVQLDTRVSPVRSARAPNSFVCVELREGVAGLGTWRSACIYSVASGNDSRASEDTHMYVATHDSIGRQAAAMLIAVPFALLACSGDEKTQSTVAVAEASPVAVDTPTVSVESAGTTVAPEAAFETPLTAYNAGEYRIAAGMYRVEVGTKPGDAYGHYMLGLSSWKSGDFDGAVKAFDKSLELDPGFARGYFNKARVLLDLNRAPEALETIEKGRAIDSTSPDGWRLKARAQAESGDVDGAMATYRELLVRDDSDVWGLNNYGVLLLDRGEFEEALGPLARLVQVRPTSPLFQNNFGMALERSGYKVAALRHYEEGVRHDSTFAKAVKNAERLKALGLDPAAAEVVSELELAEQFRQKVKSLKDGGTK